jgi:hypothetical protein
MKVAIVFEMPDSVAARIENGQYGDERFELRLRRADGILRADMTSMQYILPALAYTVSHRLPLAEPILLAEQNHFVPTPADMALMAERMKDASGTYRQCTVRLSARFRELRPLEIQGVIDDAVAVIAKADPSASTLWRFVDGGVFDDDGDPLTSKSR